jgi:tetratricopeptide (TPR) repeat protein
MSQPTVSCPHCHTLLRSDRPIPPGVSLRCPDCRGSFTAPPPLPLSFAEPRLIGAPFLIAVTVSVLIGGALLGAAVILSLPRMTGSARNDEPDPRAEAERQRLEAERKKLVEDRQGFEAERKKAELGRLLARGEEALKKDQYAEAEKVFDEALRVAPGDAAALRGLVAARAGQATAGRAREEDARKQAEVERLLEDGKKALADKQLARAVQLLESARTLAPASRPVLDALHEARNALDADKDAKRTLTEFRKHMDAGKAALDGERFGDAVREFMAALRLVPEDLEAQQGRKQAEAKLAAVADVQKRRDAFADLLGRGQRALQAKRFNEAVAALDAAVRLMPDDREAQRSLREARQSQKALKSENGKLLADANEAMRLGRLEEAQRLAQQAVDNWPEDTQAEKLLKSITRQVEDARTAQAAYLRYIDHATLAMATRRYADAVRAYTEALRLVPGDLEVMRQLRLARVELDRELRGRVEYEKQLRNANGLLLRRSYNDAIKAFEAALKLLPEDPVALTGLSKAKYGQAMLDGQRALAQRKKNEAIQAFEAALTEKPGDLQAQNGLRMARALR